MTYSEKLLSPRWQKKRLEVFRDANWKCQECGSGDKSLHVHHVNYRKGAEPWDYPDDNFQVFCEDCHSLREEILTRLVSSFRVCLKDIPNRRLDAISQKIITEAMKTL